MNVNPRKFPKQARARATVEAILVATAQLLVEQGFEKLTTARVAERAGVSIGSLYQYFPNKQALAAAVVDHYGEKFASSFIEAVVGREYATLSASIDAIIQAGFVSHPLEPELHRVLRELAPRVNRLDKARQISCRIARAIEDVLARHRREIASDLNLEEAAALIETILETVVHRALEHHPVSVGGQRSIDACRRLILAYLKGPAPGEKSSDVGSVFVDQTAKRL